MDKEKLKEMVRGVMAKARAIMSEIKDNFKADEDATGARKIQSRFVNLWKSGTPGRVTLIATPVAVLLLLVLVFGGGGSGRQARSVIAQSPVSQSPVPSDKNVQSIIENMVEIPVWQFMMGKFEVTQKQWVAVMGDNPSEFKGADNPVENVSWDDCKKFLERLNAMPDVKESGMAFRLPTEAEWEYACRAGSTGVFSKLADGTEITEATLGEVAWCSETSDDKTHPVGQKKPNAFGLYDMHGNTWEWCEDLYEVGSSNRVARGGSWINLGWQCASRGQLDNTPDTRHSGLGFRLVASRKTVVAKRTGCIQSLIENMVEIPGKNFKMGKFEVTQKQWGTVMGDNPSEPKGDDNPVEDVSWNDCKKFLERLNALPEVKESGVAFRLPTEAEWEYACRAGSTGDYCKLADGTEITENTLGKVAWYDENSNSESHPVGQKKPNAFGLYDMHGNMWEWCEDLYQADKSHRAVRGGSWFDDTEVCAARHRLGNDPAVRCYNFGVRLAADKK